MIKELSRKPKALVVHYDGSEEALESAKELCEKAGAKVLSIDEKTKNVVIEMDNPLFEGSSTQFFLDVDNYLVYDTIARKASNLNVHTKHVLELTYEV